MKKNSKIILCITLIFLLILIATGFISTSNNINNNFKAFSQVDAISKVIKEYPDFPANVSSFIIRKIPIGGPQGSIANVKFTTQIKKIRQSVYTVTITKDWGITINGRYVKSFWEYNVTPSGIILINSDNNDDLPNTMK